MIWSIEELTEKIRPIAERHGLKEVYLFGSYARGDATEESDVDLLIDTEKIGGFEYCGMCDELENTLNKSVDVVMLVSLERTRKNPLGERFAKEIELDRRRII